MRLIDADAVNVKQWFASPDNRKRMTEALAAAPTIAAEPVRHGENVSGVHPTDEFLCSRCGFSCEITELRRDECGMGEANCYEYDCKYCPDCGAKMDAKETIT